MTKQTTIPQEIGKNVLALCKKINTEKPCYISVVPEPYAVIYECFPNVEQKIKKNGGSSIVGWQIWLWPEKYIEAEFYAIWRSPTDEFLDITPKRTKTERILFLPDKNKIYEGRNVNNIRMALNNNELINVFFKLNDLIFHVLNLGNREAKREIRLKGEEVTTYQWLNETKSKIQGMLFYNYTIASNCLCGQNKTYKDCCYDAVVSSIKYLEEKYNL